VDIIFETDTELVLMQDHWVLL